MRSTQAAAFASGWLMRPAVGITLLYGGLVVCWFLYLSVTLQFPTLWHEGDYRLISPGLYWLFTASNLLLAAWLLSSLRDALRAPKGLLRGQTAGVALALLFLGVLQIGAQGLHRAWPAPVEDRASLNAHVAGFPTQQTQLIDELGELLAAHLPDYRERLVDDVLHVRGAGELQGSLSASEHSVTLRLYGGAHVLDPEPPAGLAATGLGIRAPAPGRLNVTLPAQTPPDDRAELNAYLTEWLTAARGPH